MSVQYVSEMKSSSLIFRIRGLHNEDYGKSHVRLDREHMEKLDIKNGDVVKIFGTKNTGAKCFTLEPGYEQPFDANFIFLDDASKNVPLMRVSNIVSSNVRGGGVGSLVEVSRAEAVDASKIILAIPKIIHYEKETLDLTKLEGLVVCKGDRVNISHVNSINITPFLVHGAFPKSDFHTICKNTQFEFIEVSQEDFHFIPELERLRKVIPVIKQIKTEIFELTFPALEVYDTGTRFYLYVKEKLNPQRQEFGHPTLFPTMKIWDDLGNSYAVFRYQGQGGYSNNMADFHYSMYGIMVPALDSKAKALNFVIQEISWHRMPSPGTVVARVESGKRPAANFMTPSKMTIEVMGKPWEFKISLR